ncbi:MAG: DNA primase [Lentimicrobiaceae bacterium]|nr:DNA primase [Lentimicrobiaceae bacterium]
MIRPEVIQTILETARIEEVVGEFVSLRKRGTNYIGLCPFHNEKTPSFNVSPARGIFKCFGCGKAGNSVGFIMEHEHYSYPEALKFLARKYHIEVEEEEQTPEQIQVQNRKESLYHTTAFAQKFFTSSLFENEEGKAVGLTYFHERGFHEETIKKFQLGYCFDKWDTFTRHALENAYKLELLNETGLTISREGKNFDFFRGRVMFPVHNLTGSVIGFGGRILTGDKTKPKYINSPESDIYNKSKALYGIFFAKNAILAQDNCFLVEGYTDVISLHQAGIENVVASSGTSLTPDQIKLVKRFTPNITILYDGDPAGIKASFRGIDMILEEGMNVKIVLFPEGEDPDSFARTRRSVEVQAFISNNASDFINFKTGLLLNETAGDPIQKTRLIKEIVGTIALIPDAITRTVYIRECSMLMNITEQALMNELNKVLRNRFTRNLTPQEKEAIPEVVPIIQPRQATADTLESEFQEHELIRLMLLYGNKPLQCEVAEETPFKRKYTVEVKVANYILNDLKKDNLEFKNPLYQAISAEFSNMENAFPDEQYFFNNPNHTLSVAVIDILSTPYQLSKNWSKKHIVVPLEEEKLKEAVDTSILAFKAKRVEQMITDNIRALKLSTDEEEVISILTQLKSLKDISNIINGKLGRIVTR